VGYPKKNLIIFLSILEILKNTGKTTLLEEGLVSAFVSR
jgi:hypothetical protein